MKLKEKLEAIRNKAEAELKELTSAEQLENFRVQVLGKKGELTSILKMMGSLSAEERPIMGQKANEVRAFLEERITEKANELKQKEMQMEIIKDLLIFAKE